MPSFTYHTNIPDAPNNPSADQPLMKDNTNSTNGIINIDHYTFQNANNWDGYHRQSTYPKLSGIPSTTAADFGVVYTQTGFTVPAAETELFYTPDVSTNQYQMTRCNSGNYSKLSAFIDRGAGTTVDKAGWTFLPGGSANGALLYFYGNYYKTSGTIGSSGSISFPFSFNTAPFAINITVSNGSGIFGEPIGVMTQSASGFTWAGANVNFGFFWTAIGF